MNKIFFYIIGLLILGIILFFFFVQIPKNTEIPQGANNLEIYDTVDSSVNEFLSNSSENQTQNLYDAVDASVEQFLKK